MSNEEYPVASQDDSRLAQSAELANFTGQPVGRASCVASSGPTLAQRSVQLTASSEPADAQPSCQQCLTVSFFFDGTGNNMDSDMPTDEHSNVVRLYLAHKETDVSLGLYKWYIPGIGTYFKDIGDDGNSTRGLAFGAQGQARLDWAMKQFDQALAYHVALANNPTNKIAMIRVAAFGFSRGATAARAFARDFQKRCIQVAGGWQWKQGGYPVRFNFLGIWDTVASVGLPMSANSVPLRQSFGWEDTQTAVSDKSVGSGGVQSLAFGVPGADPSPGMHDGHSSWASPLDVPSMVERCVHMVAAHEIRNSFPLDSCLRDAQYPSSVEESVYPGVHSDVGGGYRPGEGARSIQPGAMLSLLPLRAMHKRAWECGVPIYPISALPTIAVQKGFGVDESSAKDFEAMVDSWRHYMDTAGWGGHDIGTMFNSHMRVYYGWRFLKIRLNWTSRAAGKDTADGAVLKNEEAGWAREKADLEAQMTRAKSLLDSTQAQLSTAESRLAMAEQAETRYGRPVDPQLQQRVNDERRVAGKAADEYLKLKARHDTLPGTEGALAKNLDMYDDRLIADAQLIWKKHIANPGLSLRPHYKVLLDAYFAEFIENKGLRDEKIIAFFDNYVHDSLAGFARDATLPSDPRVIYVGGDVKAKYALLERSRKLPSEQTTENEIG